MEYTVPRYDSLAIVQALSLRDDNELEDEIDDAAADADAEQAKRARKAAKLKKEPKSMDEGGGM